MKPFFNLLAKAVCKVSHFFSFLVGYHTGIIITFNFAVYFYFTIWYKIPYESQANLS